MRLSIHGCEAGKKGHAVAAAVKRSKVAESLNDHCADREMKNDLHSEWGLWEPRDAHKMRSRLELSR